MNLCLILQDILALDPTIHARDLTVFDSLLDSELGEQGNCQHTTPNPGSLPLSQGHPTCVSLSLSLISYADDGGGQHFATIEVRGSSVLVSFPTTEAIILSDAAYILKGGMGISKLMIKHFAPGAMEGRHVPPLEEQVLECALLLV